MLLQGLRDDVYQLIILPYPVEEPGIAYVKYGEEHLFFSLPPAHPLSGSRALYMRGTSTAKPCCCETAWASGGK